MPTCVRPGGGAPNDPRPRPPEPRTREGEEREVEGPGGAGAWPAPGTTTWRRKPRPPGRGLAVPAPPAPPAVPAPPAPRGARSPGAAGWSERLAATSTKPRFTAMAARPTHARRPVPAATGAARRWGPAWRGAGRKGGSVLAAAPPLLSAECRGAAEPQAHWHTHLPRAAPAPGLPALPGSQGTSSQTTQAEKPTQQQHSRGFPVGTFPHFTFRRKLKLWLIWKKQEALDPTWDCIPFIHQEKLIPCIFRDDTGSSYEII
ncbi:uncharacterized protein LOC141489524 [Macrotis lagotis]|uniref:uncharacterized protein LOC141489524 n=1 Tax=Macrotis lagotis TaxID=92651 RepID=UPI003D692F44